MSTLYQDIYLYYTTVVKHANLIGINYMTTIFIFLTFTG